MDNLSKKQRSYCMARVRSKDTALETLVQRALAERGLSFDKHMRSLPGRPDVVFAKSKLAVFVDGDFWHGYRFPGWRKQVPRFWQEKISNNRRRDKRNFQRLRRKGWTVIRIWQHQLERDLTSCIDRVVFKHRLLSKSRKPVQRRV